VWYFATTSEVFSFNPVAGSCIVNLARAAMRRFVFVLVASTYVTIAAQAASFSTPSEQEVRFNKQTVPSGVTPPRVISHPTAAYTNEARQRGIQGSVIVQAQFDADGNFKVLQIVKGLGYGLDESALAALHNWRFLPALRNGERVSAIAEIEVPFRLATKLIPADELERLIQGLEKLPRGVPIFSLPRR
jgi:TonB family protein